MRPRMPSKKFRFRRKWSSSCWMMPALRMPTPDILAAQAPPIFFPFPAGRTLPEFYFFHWTRCAGSACCMGRIRLSMPCGFWPTAWVICAAWTMARTWMTFVNAAWTRAALLCAMKREQGRFALCLFDVATARGLAPVREGASSAVCQGMASRKRCDLARGCPTTDRAQAVYEGNEFIALQEFSEKSWP